MAVHQILAARMADADAHALVVIADMRADRAQAVVARDAAADLHAHLGGRQLDLVVEHRDVGQRPACRNASPRRPRGRTRSCRCRAAAAGPSRRRSCLRWRRPGSGGATARSRWRLGDRLHHHESDVVAVARVLGARIAEPDEQQHGSGTSRDVRTGPGTSRDRRSAEALLLLGRRSRCRGRSRRCSRRTGRRGGGGFGRGCGRCGGCRSRFGRRLHFFGVAGRRHDGDQRDVAVLQHLARSAAA